MHPRPELVGMEKFRDLSLGAVLQEHKGLLAQVRKADIFLPGQRMALRQDGHEPVPAEIFCIKALPGGESYESAVYSAVPDPIFYLFVIPQQKFVIYSRVVLLKSFYDLRQPVGCHAGKCPDPDHAGLDSFEIIDLHLKLPVFLAQMLCAGEKLQAMFVNQKVSHALV